MSCPGWLLAALNYVVARNSKSWDLTKNKRQSLGPDEEDPGLPKEDIKVVYLVKSERMAEGQDRLKGFEKESSHLKVEYTIRSRSLHARRSTR
jgi:hypothetical protein